jgi:butyrate kinase
MIIAFGGALYIRTFLTRRAIFKVIEIFYQHNALGINSAKTLHQLGLKRPDLLQRMMSRRDYKQNALQILVKRGIIIENEDGRLYMVEEKLDEHLRSKRR